MSLRPFVFATARRSIAKNDDKNTRYYIADTMNLNSTLFIARSHFTDSLIRGDPELENFKTIYTTRLCERICFASASVTQPWVLIGLLKYSDLCADRANIRTVFVDWESKEVVEYPVSNYSNTPHYVGWSYDQEESVFLYTDFSGKIETYSVAYEALKNSFQLTQKRDIMRSFFRTGIINQTACTVLIGGEKSSNPMIRQYMKTICTKITDHTRSDGFPQGDIPLPPIAIRPDSDFVLLVANSRNADAQSLKCIIFANTDELDIVVPASGKYMALPIDYIRNEAAADVPLMANDLYGLMYDPITAAHEPVNRLPFIMNFGEFVLVGAPHKFVTAFLIDQSDRIRAAFRTEVPCDGIDMFNARSLNDNASKIMTIDTGDIFTCDINPQFFVERDPSFIIPMLHCATYVKLELNKLVTIDVLKTFWNGEVFNEALLMEYNKSRNAKFGYKLCSTFAKEKYYPTLNLFRDYSEPKSQIDKVHNFREVMSKLPKALLESVEITEPQTLFRDIVQLLESESFILKHYEESIRYYVWLQLSAIRFSLTETQGVMKYLPPEMSQEIRKHWVTYDILPLDTCWPKVDSSENPITQNDSNALYKAERNWWYLRREKVKIVKTESSGCSRMFEFVEDLTNRADSGPRIFRLHQFLLGLELTDPICDL